MQKIRNSLAIRHIGALIAEVGKGESYVLTSHGRPLALLGPVPADLTIEEIAESPIGKPKAADPEGA